MITLYYHQYKYKIGISLFIIIILLYLIYSNYHHVSTDILSMNDTKDTIDTKDIKDIKDNPLSDTRDSIDKDSIIQEYKESDEFKKLLKLLIREINKSTSSINILTKDYVMKQEVLSMRNMHSGQLFAKDIEKIKILIDSKNMDHSDDHTTSNYIIYFDGGNRSNKTGGFGTYKNVIGFRLLKAMIPNSSHHITDNNKKFKIHFDGSYRDITLDNGSYSTYTLANHLQVTLNDHSHISGMTVTYNSTTQQYTISHSSETFYFDWTVSGAYRLFGFLNKKESSSVASKTRISNHAIDFSGHFVDLVIPEIPYITCKRNGRGANIIERIPLHSGPGNLVTYYAHSSEVQTQTYFYPMKLSQLNIQLYEDTDSNFYDSQNADNSFEFELTILNNTKLLN